MCSSIPSESRFSLSKKGFEGDRSKVVFRMKCYRTSGFVDETSKSQLRMCVLAVHVLYNGVFIPQFHATAPMTENTHM